MRSRLTRVYMWLRAIYMYMYTMRINYNMLRLKPGTARRRVGHLVPVWVCVCVLCVWVCLCIPLVFSSTESGIGQTEWRSTAAVAPGEINFPPRNCSSSRSSRKSVNIWGRILARHFARDIIFFVHVMILLLPNHKVSLQRKCNGRWRAFSFKVLQEKLAATLKEVHSQQLCQNPATRNNGLVLKCMCVGAAFLVPG